MMEENTVEENIGLGCALEFFSEYDEVSNMIDDLHNIYLFPTKVEISYDRMKYLLNQYKEQPHLLDSHLDSLLMKIILIIRDENIPMELKHKAFRYLHLIINVRGFKIVVNHLPHEVADLEPVLSLLQQQEIEDISNWETKYCLLLWLSIIIMIPFHMSRFDSNADNSVKTVTERIFEIIKNYLVVSNKCCDAAVYFAAKFLTRTDIKTTHLSDFLDWAFDCVLDSTLGWKRLGPLSVIAAILKHGKREDLHPYASSSLNRLEQSNCKNDSYRLTRKLSIKIIQRIGLLFLPIRIAAWRYKRGCRSLTINLSGGDPGFLIDNANNKLSDQNESEVEDSIDIPDEIEQIIDVLLMGLRDADITVRWSAAKGIGRVTSRLPKYFADEVVGTILELLNPKHSDTAWHGACLALAELGKRGLLLPERLKEVIPLIVKALVYDEPHGAMTVGSLVRDAACYVSWSFARAYDTAILLPYVNQLASALLVVTCFDREINCRRAASAAFQEHVGRQGTFPHGIDILTNADYFAVGVRTNAFLKISVYIAGFEEYTQTLINHLVEKKLNHVDIRIRELAAQALHNLTPKAPKYVASQILPQIFQMVNSINLNERHGAILALGEIFTALSLEESKFSDVEPQLIENAQNLIKLIRERHQFKGYSGELMKQACCHFIQKCSLAHLELLSNQVTDEWQLLIDECLSHEVPAIRTQAVEALAAVMAEYYGSNPTKIKEIAVKYIKKLKDSHEITRMGFAQALGNFGACFLKDNELLIINALMESLVITPVTLKWSESRRDAIKALTSIWNKTVVSEETESPSCSVCLSLTSQFFQCFLTGLDEYTTDSRGDIGAWVREAAMSGLQSLLTSLASIKPQLITKEFVEKTMSGIARQSVERIDRTRALAGKIFFSLIYYDPKIPHIPNHSEIKEICTAEKCAIMNWLSVEDIFPVFTKLLSYESYTYSVLLGLIMSIGGLTECLIKCSVESFLEFLRPQPNDELHRFASIIVTIYKDNSLNERIVLPLMKFLDRILSSNNFKVVLDDPDSVFASELLNLTKLEINNSKVIPKLNSAAQVFCQLIQVKGSVSKQALMRLSMLLCHQCVSVRKTVATRLYESLIIFSEECNLSDEKLDEALVILSDTEWDFTPINELREKRNKLCEVLNIPPPKVVSQK